MKFDTPHAHRGILPDIGNRLGAEVGVDPCKGYDPSRMLLHRGDDTLILDPVVGVRVRLWERHHHVDAVRVHINDQLAR